jgi:PAS domain S-box-containing protein
MFQTEEYLGNIINVAADPIFVKDRQHRYILLNDSMCEFMGRKREDLIGKSDYDFFPKEEADVFWSKDEEVFNLEKENTNEEFFTDASDIRHTIVTKKTIYTDKKGAKIIVGIIRDITQQKKIEIELQQRAIETERMNALMVGRELKMVELKKEIEELKKRIQPK